MFEARAFAKLSLSLQVSDPDRSGLHPIRGRFQSVDWADRLGLTTAEADAAATSLGGAIIDGMENLAWRAVGAVRDIAVTRPPLALSLDKDVPVAAGLGGGSADAAAALAMAGALLGVDRSDLADLAPGLGSDVAFCLVGGTANVGGFGELVESIPQSNGYAVALVVPPIEVPTAAVYRRWDQLGGPSGRALDPHAVPPSLRSQVIVNDLYAAAVAVAPEIDEWRAELQHRWGRPVALAGSGPTLFSFFVDRGEAAAATNAVPAGARGARAVEPIDYGWVVRATESGHTTDSKGRAHPDPEH